jgi:hypothetical protein
METNRDAGQIHKARTGRQTVKKAALFSALALVLVLGTVSFSMPTALAANTITVQGKSLDGKTLNMWITVKQNGSTVKTGFTPLTFSGATGSTYTIIASDYSKGNIYFDHWGNGSTNKARTVTLKNNVWFDAFYKTGSSSTSLPPPSTSGISSLIPKTGVFVALYMYLRTTGSVHWQKVIDEKTKHPSVPIVAVFNPSSGPGSAKDSNIVNWVAKLKNAGVIALGYTYDDYGTRSLSALKADTDKYKNWYNADGLFMDEFTNKAGYESHYRSVTTYAKSLGMKMTMGNPGTDVPQSYIGTVDVINITEGKGYMPISWLQYCISCTSSGWHDDYDKRNFAYIRYDIDWLDTAFETESSKWVGLLYITNGDDSNHRWFHVPPYFSTLVATLDK